MSTATVYPSSSLHPFPNRTFCLELYDSDSSCRVPSLQRSHANLLVIDLMSLWRGSKWQRTRGCRVIWRMHRISIRTNRGQDWRHFHRDRRMFPFIKALGAAKVSTNPAQPPTSCLSIPTTAWLAKRLGTCWTIAPSRLDQSQIHFWQKRSLKGVISIRNRGFIFFVARQ